MSLCPQCLCGEFFRLDANFGAGLCGLMMITQDPQIQTAYDEWTAFLDTVELFQPENGGGLSGAGSPPGLIFPSTAECFEVPLLVIPTTICGLGRNVLSNNYPTIGGLQDLIRSELLPRLDYAISRLTVVAQDQSYVFTVTPQMQGDPDEDALELDYTEICAGLVMLQGARAAADILVAYDFNFTSYESLGMLEAFEQTNSFLGLTSGGAANLVQAKSSLLSAINYLESGINFLMEEGDDQSNDIIKIGGDFDIDDLNEILDYADSARQALEGEWIVSGDWDDNSSTPDEELTIYIIGFFDGGIDNFKAMLPPYTVTVEWDTADWSYEYNYLRVLTCSD